MVGMQQCMAIICIYLSIRAFAEFYNFLKYTSFLLYIGLTLAIHFILFYKINTIHGI